METLKNTILNAAVYQKLLDGQIDSLYKIVTLSPNEIRQCTDLPNKLIDGIKRKVCNAVLSNIFLTADQIPSWDRFSTGCCNIDNILRGGFPTNRITEIYGTSGVGKTQFCLQLALMMQLPINFGGKEKEVVYICTEDTFPSKRFHQLVNVFKNRYNLPHRDFEKMLYLDHVADFEQLRRCLCVRLPTLLGRKNIGLIIIDSIAGIFRSENDLNYTTRSQNILMIISTLNNLCDLYNLTIICVNQVTANLTNGKTEPCLGLTWSNNLVCRFNLTRYNNSQIRNFEIVFAPDLPNNKCNFTISEEGIVTI